MLNLLPPLILEVILMDLSLRKNPIYKRNVTMYQICIILLHLKLNRFFKKYNTRTFVNIVGNLGRLLYERREVTLLQLGSLYSKGRHLTSVILRVYYTHSFFLNMFGITCLAQDAKSKNISYWIELGIRNFSTLSKVAVNIPQLL